MIYFTTEGGGIQKFSPKTSQVTRLWNSSEPVFGIAFDAANNILYWTSVYTIYRATIEQAEPEPEELLTTFDRKYYFRTISLQLN